MNYNPTQKALKTVYKNTKLAGCCHHQNAKQVFWDIFLEKNVLILAKKKNGCIFVAL
jgi:hypothetical protein